MKAIFSFLLILPAFLLSAQGNGIPLSISYFGNYAYQPGIKVGTSLNLKSLNASTNDTQKSFILDPQVAFYLRPNAANNLIINTNIGYKIERIKNGKMRYQALAIGLGYLNRSTKTSDSISLGSGETVQTNRASSGFIYPSINYEFGRQWNPRMGWFSRYSIGQLLSSEEESEFNASLELGLSFKL